MATHIQQAGSGNPFTCRYLGLQDDPQTSFAFPSDWNTCHRCKPVVAISLIHQQDYCLTRKHPSCPVFVQDTQISLPRELRNQRQVHSGTRKLPWGLILGAILLVSLLALGVGFAPQLGAFLPPATQASSIASSPTPSPVPDTPSPEPSLSPTPVLPLASETPIPADASLISLTPADPVEVVATPTITRIPRDLETLIGINYLFKIHRVRQGENLNLLAYEYGTTIAAISAVNYHFSTPLWVQQVIIIPVNQKDVSGLPAFEAYRVVEDSDLETLAAQLGVDPEGLQYYNGLGTSDQVSTGEWLVVPREE